MVSEKKTELPLPDDYDDEASYVSNLFSFVTGSFLHRKLVSSVHILDFFTSSPDLYENTLDKDWREWIALHDIDTLLDFLLHEKDEILQRAQVSGSWRDQASPPATLLEYLRKLRSLQLRRYHTSIDGKQSITRQLSVGMKPKKIHEVDHCARYVQKLTDNLARNEASRITHLVDFGAGQGYLGRFLASEPSNRNVIAVESRPNNVHAAKALDVLVKIAPMSGVMRNKKEYRAGRMEAKKAGRSLSPAWRATRFRKDDEVSTSKNEGEALPSNSQSEFAKVDSAVRGKGSVQYVSHQLCDGDLHSIVHGLKEASLQQKTVDHASDDQTEDPETSTGQAKAERPNRSGEAEDPRLLVMSLHSCGNLSHHALRSLTVNPAVKAVAVIGCCYNLLTERLVPPSYKSEYLRPQEAHRNGETASTGDPQGFPMSKRLCEYQSALGTGITFNITARMMAVQAPSNWTRDEAHSFFTKHFFRALLQRVLVDRKIVKAPMPEGSQNGHEDMVAPASPAGGGGSLQPIVIGSLSKGAYKDFPTYARTAIERVQKSNNLNEEQRQRLDSVTGEELQGYAQRFEHRRKEIGVMWTLMALSATLVEATIVVDRYLWMKEQDEIERCWIEPVFDYKQSPRNLVAVGIKKTAK